MKNSFPLPLALGLTLAILLTSCVTDSETPLSSPDTAQADQQLVGDWRMKKDSDNDTFRFSTTKGAWMHVQILPDKPGDKQEDYDLFPTVIGHDHFLNVVQIGKDDQGHPAKRYVFLRYKISSGRVLRMWMMSQDAAANAVRTGKLKGVVHGNQAPILAGKMHDTNVDVTFEETSANLAAFIQNGDAKALFNEKMEPLYRMESTGH